MVRDPEIPYYLLSNTLYFQTSTVRDGPVVISYTKIESPSFPLEIYRLEYTRLDRIIGDKFVHFRTTTERIPMITAIEFVAFYLQPSGFGREKLTGLFDGRYRHTLNRLVSNSPTWRAYSLYSISGKTHFDWIEKKSQAKAKTELLHNGHSS